MSTGTYVPRKTASHLVYFFWKVSIAFFRPLVRKEYRWRAPAVEGIDLFHIAGRSISWRVKSFKMSTAAPVKQPFCSQLEERLLLGLEYPVVASYARGDIGPQFAATSRLPMPKPGEDRLKERRKDDESCCLAR